MLNNDNFSKDFDEVITKLVNIEELNYVFESVDSAISFRVNANEYFVPLTGSINVEEEIEKLTKELEYTEGFLKSVQKKLSNERFVAGAPEQVVANEKKKRLMLSKIDTLKASIASLS